MHPLGYVVCSQVLVFLKEQRHRCLNIASANFISLHLCCSEVTLAVIIKRLHRRKKYKEKGLSVASLLAHVKVG